MYVITPDDIKYYLGGLYEKQVTPADVKLIHYIGSPSGMVAIYTMSTSEGNKLEYVLKDHLGSTQMLVNEAGQFVEEYSYDIWGLRRDPATWQVYVPGSHTSQTDIGFTGHEHIDLFGLVNMDGRIYDPVLGRFTSADPVLQFPDDTQGLNPYAYCMNNPLRFVDPTGYSFGDVFFDAIRTAGIVLVSAAAVAINPAAIFAALPLVGTFAAMDGLNAIAKGSNTNLFFDHILSAVAFSAISTGATSGIGNAFGNTTKSFWHEFARATAHGTSNGLIRMAQGGKFEHGFFAGFVSSGVSSLHLSDEMWANTAISSAVGGTSEAIGGGKFMNGAITGAFTFLFNHLPHMTAEEDYAASTGGLDFMLSGGNSGKPQSAQQLFNQLYDMKIGQTIEGGTLNEQLEGIKLTRYEDGFNIKLPFFKEKLAKLGGYDPNHRFTIEKMKWVDGKTDIIKYSECYFGKWGMPNYIHNDAVRYVYKANANCYHYKFANQYPIGNGKW